jgi:serine/threonine protein kinase
MKLENIMMVDESDDSDLKLVDFGLSKMLGPSETCTEPFGTLVCILNSLNKPSRMLHLKSSCKSHMERMSTYGLLESLSM